MITYLLNKINVGRLKSDFMKTIHMMYESLVLVGVVILFIDVFYLQFKFGVFSIVGLYSLFAWVFVFLRLTIFKIPTTRIEPVLKYTFNKKFYVLEDAGDVWIIKEVVKKMVEMKKHYIYLILLIEFLNFIKIYNVPLTFSLGFGLIVLSVVIVIGFIMDLSNVIEGVLAIYQKKKKMKQLPTLKGKGI